MFPGSVLDSLVDNGGIEEVGSWIFVTTNFSDLVVEFIPGVDEVMIYGISGFYPKCIEVFEELLDRPQGFELVDEIW